MVQASHGTRVRATEMTDSLTPLWQATPEITTEVQIQQGRAKKKGEGGRDDDQTRGRGEEFNFHCR